MGVRRKWLWPSFLASMMLGYLSSPIQAQFFCGQYQIYPCYGTYHWIDGSGSGVTPVHFDCRLCPAHIGCHDTCDPQDDDYDAVLAAGSLGDRESLLDYAEAGTEFIAYNENRQALAILDCTKTALVAHLPLGVESAVKAASLVRAGSLQTTVSWLSSLSRKHSAGGKMKR